MLSHTRLRTFDADLITSERLAGQITLCKTSRLQAPSLAPPLDIKTTMEQDVVIYGFMEINVMLNVDRMFYYSFVFR